MCRGPYLQIFFLDPRYNITLSKEQSATSVQYLTDIWICLKQMELNKQDVNSINLEGHQNENDNNNPTDPLDDLEIEAKSKS